MKAVFGCLLYWNEIYLNLPAAQQFHEFAVEPIRIVVLLQALVQRFALGDKAEVEVLVVPVAVAHVRVAENFHEVLHPRELVLSCDLHVDAELVAGDGQVVLGAEVESVLDAFLQTSLVPLAVFDIEAGGGTGLGCGVVAGPGTFNLEERVANPCCALVRKRDRGVGVETIDGVVVVHRSQVLEFAGAVPLVGADYDGVLRGVLADGPENFILYFVPNKRICGRRFIQEFHHHAGLSTVAFRHERPHLGGVFAGIGAYEEGLFLRASQMEVMSRTLVQVEDYVEVVCLDVLDGLVQESENVFFGLEGAFFKKIEVVYRKPYVVEPSPRNVLMCSMIPGKPTGSFSWMQST